MIITVGTKNAEILSANHWIGALDHWASSINLIIWDNAVSSQTFVALNSKLQSLLIVQANTFDQIFFSTGILSQVSMDSSILEYQETISQSTGTFSQGLTIIISQFITSSIAISTAFSHLLTLAVFGASHINFSIASEVFHFAFASRNFQIATKVIKKAATSKYIFGIFIPFNQKIDQVSFM